MRVPDHDRHPGKTCGKVVRFRSVVGTVSEMKTVSGLHAGTSYTVQFMSDGIALEVLSEGSPAGGSGSESHLGVTAESYTAFLGKLGLTHGELPEYLASLHGEQWREFWHLVSEFASSRFTWFDTGDD